LSDASKIYPIEGTPHPERPFGLKDLVTFAAGMVISSAVFSLQAPATAFAGRAAWIAYLVAVVLGFITVIPYFLVTGAVIYRGGDYALVKLGLGKLPGGLYIWNYIVMNLAFALSAAAVNMYVKAIWPAAPGRAIAVAVIVFFFVINIMPVKIIKKTQNFMFLLLMLSFAIYILYGLFRLQPGTFVVSAPGYFRNGSRGFIKAVTTLTFSTSVYVTVMNLGAGARNPRKHIPWAMLLTAGIIFLAYPLMSLVTSNTLPIEEVAGKTLVVVAKEIMPFGFFVFFVICGPFLAVATTLNAGFLGSSRPFERATENGWFPKKFAWTNRYGSPVWCVFALFAVTLIPVLLTDNVAVIANSATMVQYIVKILTLFAAWNIPRKFPEYWKSGLFGRLPLSMFYFIMTICTAVQAALIVMSMMTLTPLQVSVSISCMAVLSIICLVWFGVNRKKISIEVKTEELS
jgi:APA family basic amino acid/polyamine antiporter